MTTFIVTAGMIILFVLGIPVGYSLGIAGMLAYLNELGTRVNIPMLSQRMQYGVNNFLLLAIPLFILAAKLMNTAGITTRLFNFARCLVGFLPGGLGHANTVASLIFAGLSGAAVADAAGLGQVELKAMKDEGYDSEFSVAITAASSTIGPIFPPSIPMVIYALVAEESVGKLFLGGVVPGLIMTGALMLMVGRRSCFPAALPCPNRPERCGLRLGPGTPGCDVRTRSRSSSGRCTRGRFPV